jgi:hypothetical protein
VSAGWFRVVRCDRDAILAKLGPERSPSAVAVWLGLLDIGNRERSSSFSVTSREIARVSGTSHRTVQRVLPLLKDIGLLEWEQVRLPCTNALVSSLYTLKSHEPSATMAEPPATMAGPYANESRERGGVIYSKTSRKEEGRRKTLTTTERITAEKGLEAARKTLLQLERAPLRVKQSADYKPQLEHAQQTVTTLTEDLAR